MQITSNENKEEPALSFLNLSCCVFVFTQRVVAWINISLIVHPRVDRLDTHIVIWTQVRMLHGEFYHQQQFEKKTKKRGEKRNGKNDTHTFRRPLRMQIDVILLFGFQYDSADRHLQSRHVCLLSIFGGRYPYRYCCGWPFKRWQWAPNGV